MDFNIGPSNRPIIRESQSMMNDGGGGNTGYFQRGKKKKEDEVKDLWDDTDKVELSTNKEKDDDSSVQDEDEKKGFGHKLLDKMKRYLN